MFASLKKIPVTIVSFLVPVFGLIIGLILATKEYEDKKEEKVKREKGKQLLKLAAAGFLGIIVLEFGLPLSMLVVYKASLFVTANMAAVAFMVVAAMVGALLWRQARKKRRMEMAPENF